MISQIYKKYDAIAKSADKWYLCINIYKWKSQRQSP